MYALSLYQERTPNFDVEMREASLSKCLFYCQITYTSRMYLVVFVEVVEVFHILLCETL